MVVFSRSRKVGEGINLRRNDLEVDLIVKKISGPRNFHSAVLEVRGVEEKFAKTKLLIREFENCFVNLQLFKLL